MYEISPMSRVKDFITVNEDKVKIELRLELTALQRGGWRGATGLIARPTVQ